MRGGREDEKKMREELAAIYRETDALFAAMSCDASTECCRFGITGREPYLTAIEIDVLTRAIAASGKSISREKNRVNAGREKKRLPLAHPAHAPSDRACPLLSNEGRCIAYAARPFGCRTFFCDRAEGKSPSRADVQHLSHRIAHLSARFHPENPGPRALRRVFPS